MVRYQHDLRCQRLGGNHHVQIAHRFCGWFKRRANLSVMLGSLGVPWQHFYPQHELLDFAVRLAEPIAMLCSG